MCAYPSASGKSYKETLGSPLFNSLSFAVFFPHVQTWESRHGSHTWLLPIGGGMNSGTPPQTQNTQVHHLTR